MSLGGSIFAATYDRMVAGAEKAGLTEMRRLLLAGAQGDVLEIGGGTGNNLPFYGAAVESLTVTEPEVPMLHRLQRRAQGGGVATQVLRAPAEDLPFDDDSFDVAVSTAVLCTVDDQPRALRELLRVLRPGGRLLFAEHIRSDDPRIARRQDRVNRFNRILMHGCNCNRPTLDTIRAAGFTVAALERTEFPKAPSFARPLVIGTAVAPGEPGTAVSTMSSRTV